MCRTAKWAFAKGVIMARNSNSRSSVAARTPVRNSPVPKPAPQRPATPAGAAASRSITHDLIARRAYEIWQSGQGGSEFDNWVRAERELRGR
jgi:hypothetical protein